MSAWCGWNAAAWGCSGLVLRATCRRSRCCTVVHSIGDFSFCKKKSGTGDLNRDRELLTVEKRIGSEKSLGLQIGDREVLPEWKVGTKWRRSSFEERRRRSTTVMKKITDKKEGENRETGFGPGPDFTTHVPFLARAGGYKSKIHPLKFSLLFSNPRLFVLLG